MEKERVKSIAIIVLATALAITLAFQFSGGNKAIIASSVPAPYAESSSSQPAAPAPSTSSSSAAPDISSEALPPEDGLSSSPKDNIPLEIERKFLVDIENLPHNMAALGKHYTIEQTYININPEIRVRRISGNQYYFAIKMPRDGVGLSRAEIDFTITQESYEYLVEMKMGDTIYKTRYQFYQGSTYVFVDVYSGALEGLAVVEVQFDNIGEAKQFVPPEWFGEDVTEDSRYKNAQLAINGLPEPRILP